LFPEGGLNGHIELFLDAVVVEFESIIVVDVDVVGDAEVVPGFAENGDVLSVLVALQQLDHFHVGGEFQHEGLHVLFLVDDELDLLVALPLRGEFAGNCCFVFGDLQERVDQLQQVAIGISAVFLEERAGDAAPEVGVGTEIAMMLKNGLLLHTHALSFIIIRRTAGEHWPQSAKVDIF
jgi:hypothetical protein